MTAELRPKAETIYDDQCAWCLHPLKVYTLTWSIVQSHRSMPSVANYCDSKHCTDENCERNCSEIALSTSENEEKVLHEIVRRRRKLERISEEAAHSIKS